MSTSAPDPVLIRAEQRRRLLEELADIGMELARELRDEAHASADEPGKPAQADIALKFARIARAVRQTLALEARVVEDNLALVRRLDDDQHAEARRREVEATRLAEERRRRDGAGRAAAVRIVEGFIDDGLIEPSSDEDGGDDADREALYERLDDWERGDWEPAAYADRPVGEILVEICRDLGLAPDWTQWPDEDWALDAAAAAERAPAVALPKARPFIRRATDLPFPSAAGKGPGDGGIGSQAGRPSAISLQTAEFGAAPPSPGLLPRKGEEGGDKLPPAFDAVGRMIEVSHSSPGAIPAGPP